MAVLNDAELLKADMTKGQIRNIVSSMYDMQKLRISTGNRIVQDFYRNLGIAPSTSPDDAEAETVKMITALKNEYNRITDGVVDNKVSVKKQIKLFQSGKEDKTQLKYIRNETDYKLVETYVKLVDLENETKKVLEKYVEQHPLWNDFLKDVKGCGAAMAGVIIAYIDIKKSKYVSSLFKYSGLDTVQDEDNDGNKLFHPKYSEDSVGVNKVREKIVYTYHDTGENYVGKVKKTGEFDADGNEIILASDGRVLDMEFAKKNGEPIFEDIETGKEYIGDVVVSMHGRRKGDTEMFEYVDKNGNKAMKRGITYNPILKTKLMGVFTGCLLKAKDPTYTKIYYDYRARLDGEADGRKDFTPGHKNMMAQRYMIKQFLRDLYVHWRTLEGLEVFDSYEVEKLGHKPHKYNEYQHIMAQRSKTISASVAGAEA